MQRLFCSIVLWKIDVYLISTLVNKSLYYYYYYYHVGIVAAAAINILLTITNIIDQNKYRYCSISKHYIKINMPYTEHKCNTGSTCTYLLKDHTDIMFCSCKNHVVYKCIPYLHIFDIPIKGVQYMLTNSNRVS